MSESPSRDRLSVRLFTSLMMFLNCWLASGPPEPPRTIYSASWRSALNIEVSLILLIIRVYSKYMHFPLTHQKPKSS